MDPKSQESSNSNSSNDQSFEADQNNPVAPQIRGHPIMSGQVDTTSRGDMKFVPQSPAANNQQEPNNNQEWSMVTKPAARIFPPRQGVPAFALHENGPFYIPLTLDKSVVTPFLNAMEPTADPPVHPVTISVCFLLSNPPGESKSSTRSIPPISIPIPMNVASPLKTFPPGFHGFHPPPRQLMSNNVHYNDIYHPYGSNNRHCGPDSVSGSSFSNSSSSCISFNSSTPSKMQGPDIPTNPGLLQTLPLCYSKSSSVSGSDSGKGGSGNVTNIENDQSTDALKKDASIQDNMSSSGGSSVSVPGRRPSLTAMMSPTRKRSLSRSPCGGSQGYHSWNDLPQSYSSPGTESNDFRYALPLPTNAGFFGAVQENRNIGLGPVWNRAQFVGSVSRPTKTRRMTARERDHGTNNAGRGRRAPNNDNVHSGDREIKRVQ